MGFGPQHLRLVDGRFMKDPLGKMAVKDIVGAEKAPIE